MKFLALSAAVVAGVTFYAAAYHVLLHVRTGHHLRRDVRFGIVAFGIGLYDFFCAQLYLSESVAEGGVLAAPSAFHGLAAHRSRCNDFVLRRERSRSAALTARPVPPRMSLACRISRDSRVHGIGAVPNGIPDRDVAADVGGQVLGLQDLQSLAGQAGRVVAEHKAVWLIDAEGDRFAERYGVGEKPRAATSFARLPARSGHSSPVSASSQCESSTGDLSSSK